MGASALLGLAVELQPREAICRKLSLNLSDSLLFPMRAVVASAQLDCLVRIHYRATTVTIESY